MLGGQDVVGSGRGFSVLVQSQEPAQGRDASCWCPAGKIKTKKRTQHGDMKLLKAPMQRLKAPPPALFFSTRSRKLYKPPSARSSQEKFRNDEKEPFLVW